MALSRGAAAAAVLATAAVFAVYAEACAAEPEDPVDATDANAHLETSAVEASMEARAPRAQCSVDADCTAPNGCYTAHCDGVLQACTYALCESKGRTCAAGRCDTATFTCSDAKDYSLLTTKYGVAGTTVGCTNASRCFAAVYPFVFIGTKEDVVVLRADDLISLVPTVVMRAGPAVKPAYVVASGRRLWIVGDVQGAAPPRQLQVSWIDVPSDPTSPRLETQSVTVSWPYPDSIAFPAPDGGLFLAYNDANEGLPAALLKPPVATAPTVFKVAAPPGSTLVASSGSRLVAYRFPSTVNLITTPATMDASVQPDLAIQPGLPAVAPPRFAVGPDGVVLLGGPVVADLPPPDCECTSHERITWLLPNAIATSSDVNQAVDVEAFTNTRGAGAPCHQCAVGYPAYPTLPAWIDAKTGLMATAGGGNERTMTAVRVIGRDPVTVTPERRAVTPGNFAVDRIALASSNGFGYLLVADAPGNNVTLALIDPRCDAK